MTALQRACLALGLCGSACGADTSACGASLQVGAPGHATAGEVQPILARSCALGGCHLRAPGAGDLVLDVSSAAWRTAVVGVRARENPAMELVAPGEPDRSWLVAKIFGTFCGASCDRALGCGAAMPSGEPLSDTERSIIVAWIADGAR